MTSSNEICEVSRACTSILRLSIDEQFRNEVLSCLGVTHSADAEDKMKKALRDVYNREGIHRSHTQLASQDSGYMQDSPSISTNSRIQGMEKGMNQEEDNPPHSFNEICELKFCNNASKRTLQVKSQLNDEFEFWGSQVGDASPIHQPISNICNFEGMVEGSEQQTYQQPVNDSDEFGFNILSEETLHPSSLLNKNNDKFEISHRMKGTNYVLKSVTEKYIINKYKKEEIVIKPGRPSVVEEMETSSQNMDSTQASHSIFQEGIEDEFDFWNSSF